MAVFEWVRFFAGAVFLLCGLGIFLIEMIGVFRFKYVLNRMHAAAMGDTLGIGFALAGTDPDEWLEFYFCQVSAGHRISLVCITGFFASDCASGGDDKRG